ncbi:phenylalanine-4-hydroxylase [Hymenobacter jeollabukensis]|uniref:Phenylalanine-4-hydroxylase n=1 Tax=Hymenobacter jeollabukensis TaxID=2025313 RepID=A0A5R8WWL1_9BACT|nr:phenylalanine-4-hydroxylase [Hymenobacter jeollabukensis]TLM96898.1 phenylalanine-4-hydroxylase [Hymenobacter jeollabukensis]
MKAPLFTAEDHLVWKVLFDRQTALLHRRAAAPFMAGVQRLGLSRDAAPDLNALSQRLHRLSGWEVVPAPGRVDDQTFLGLLAERKYPVTHWVRSMQFFDYLAGPDLFHDAFGHLPLLTDPEWAAWLAHFGQIARHHLHDAQAAQQLVRLFWHTAEFGLVQEGEALRVYGAGLLSSAAELHHCLAAEAPRQPLEVSTALATPIVRDGFQQQYFVLPAWAELADVTAELVVRLTATPAAPVLAPAPQVAASRVQP